jgi:hypothetical protein
MSNGYTIVRGKLSAPIYIALTVFTILFTITYAVLFIYEAEVSFLIFLKVNNSSYVSPKMNLCVCGE